MKNSPPSIDDIIQRVKAEARQYASSSNPVVGPPLQPQPQWEPQDIEPPVEPATAIFRSRTSFYLEELLLSDGDAFIRDAYSFLLGRDADPTGLEGCRLKLARSGKLSVLYSLHQSPEGRARGITILAPRLLFAVCWAQRLQAWAGLQLGMGRLLLAIERRYEHRLAAIRPFRTRLEVCEKRLAAREDRIAASEARLSVLLDLQEAQLRAKRDLTMLRSAQYDQQCQVDRLLQELATVGQAQPQAAAEWAQGHLGDKIDLYYRAFEDANRGSLKDIRAKLEGYLPRFASLRQTVPGLPVLDIGCGRGEWLQLLKEQGHTVRGIDMNPVMVAACAEQGLPAEAGDAYACLRSLPDASLAAVTGFHIIEHLPFDALFGIFEQAYRVLAPGGVILFETPNPENILVGSHTFYHDFSHRNPVTPTSVSFLAHYHQFEDIEIERRNPYPEEAKVPGDDPLTVRVNGHLCGPQDYAIIARKPAAGGVA